jgi:hypothetical protein
MGKVPREREPDSGPKPSVPEAAGVGNVPPRGRRKNANTVQPSYKVKANPIADRDKPAQRKVSFDLETLIEGASLFVHGTLGVIAHTLGMIPDNPVKAVVFVAVLILGAMYIGIEHEKSQDFCFHCVMVLAVVAVGLVVICLRNPGSNERLREMQDERVRAVGVTPFRY